MIIATAGHVDHGKTLLVKALSGIDTDRLAEEKARGLTIDLGFAYQEIDNRVTLGFVDVPGHIRFINNMLAGVGGIDHALLVVAADDGPMPQTREHLAILNLLGVKRATVALTKIDRVSPDRISQAHREIADLLEFTRLANAPVFAVSSTTGAGVSALKEHLVQAAMELVAVPVEGNFRLAIDRCFTIKGAGLVVTGSVFSGSVKPGDDLCITPVNLPVRVRGIRAQNRVTELGQAGDRCAINITGTNLNRDMISRGDWLAAPELHAPSARIDAGIQLLASETKTLKHWTPVHVHIAANHVTGRVALLEGRSLGPEEAGLVQLVLDRDISACRGDKLILRNQAASHTIGGGLVLDPFAPRRGRARPRRLAFLRAMQADSPGDALSLALDIDSHGLNLTNFARSWNLTQTAQADLFGRLVSRQIKLGSGGRDYLAGYGEPAWLELKASILAALQTWHRQHPALAGPAEKQLFQALAPVPLPEAFSVACAELVNARVISKSGAILHSPGHTASLTPAEATLWQKLEPLIRSGGLKPPVVHELANSSGFNLKQLEKFLGRASELGLLIRVVNNRLFLPATVAELTTIVETLAERSEGGQFSASDYRDATGIGRNLAIEVLEYFDRTGLTQRQGDKRKLVNRASIPKPAGAKQL